MQNALRDIGCHATPCTLGREVSGHGRRIFCEQCISGICQSVFSLIVLLQIPFYWGNAGRPTCTRCATGEYTLKFQT